MCKLEKEEVDFFAVCGFRIIKTREHYIELKGESGQYWCIYKEDDGIVLLLHRHHCTDGYHIHYVFDSSEKAVSEIFQHEKYIARRNKERDRICNGRRLQLVF